MSSTQRHHHELDENGVGKCSVPMWCNGLPADFCDAPAYGRRPECREYRNAWGELRRLDGKYAGYIPGLACPAHGGPDTRAFLDGDKWCAVRSDFVNLQESPSGWGDSSDEARLDLQRALQSGEGGKG